MSTDVRSGPDVRSAGQSAADRGWEHFPHEADIGLHGYGPTPAAAFEQVALAMTGAVVPPEHVRPERTIEMRCRAPDLETLLIDWLNTLIFEMATRRMLFGAYVVELQGDTLKASATGEAVDVGRHQPAVEIKGATYTALSVGQQGDALWHARCVVDV